MAKGKSLDDRNCPMFMTNHAAGIGTCTHDKQSHLRKNISVKKSRELKKRQPISQRETYCLFGLRILLSHWVLRWNSRLVRIVQYWRWHSGFWCTMGASIINDKWSSIGHQFGMSVRLQVARFLPDSDNHGTIQWRNSERRRTKRLSQTGKVWNYILSKLKEVRISGFKTNLQSVDPWLKGTKFFHQAADKRMFSVESKWI